MVVGRIGCSLLTLAWIHRGEVGGTGIAYHVGVALRVYGDAIANLTAAPSQISRVDEGVAHGVQLRHEGAPARPDETTNSIRRL